MGQVGSYYNPAAAAYGTLSAASMAAAAAAAAAQQSAMSGLSAPAQVRHFDQTHCPIMAARPSTYFRVADIDFSSELCRLKCISTYPSSHVDKLRNLHFIMFTQPLILPKIFLSTQPNEFSPQLLTQFLKDLLQYFPPTVSSKFSIPCLLHVRSISFSLG